MATEKKKRQEGEMFREVAKGLGTIGYELSGTGAKDRAKTLKEDQQAREAKAEKKREVRGVDSWDYIQKEMKKNPGRLIDYKNPTDGDYKKGGKVKSKAKKYASGGKVRSSCDGIAKKGKTKGRMV